MQLNRRRALADLVSLDAWKGAIDRQGRFNLHVDVAFGQARVGGESEAKARFRLTLRRAEIVVIVPETEPAEIDRATVARETPQVKVSASEDLTSQTSVGGALELDFGLGGGKPRADIGVSAQAKTQTASSAKTKVTRAGGALLVGQGKTGDGDYRWVITPAIEGQKLDGHPWDAVQSPRMKVRDKRKDLDKHIEPTVRIQARCLREDLVISDIVLKDTTVWNDLTQRPGHRNRMAAAEAVIRDRLAKAGLLHDDLGEPYAQLCLAEVSVGEEE